MEVRVREFRDSCDHLFRVVNADYHSCVGRQELERWIIIAERRFAEVEQMTCKRANEYDRGQWAGSLEAARNRLQRARERLAAMELELLVERFWSG